MKILPIVNPPFGKWNSGALLYQRDWVEINFSEAEPLFDPLYAYFVINHLEFFPRYG